MQQLDKLRTTNAITAETTWKSHLKSWIVSLIVFLLIGLITWRLLPENRKLASVSQRTTVTEGATPLNRPPLDLKMVDIPAGQYTMGGIPGDSRTIHYELPRRSIDIKKPFRISAYEITIAQFKQFVTATGYKSDAEKSGQGGWLPNRRTSYGRRDPKFVWSSPGYTVNDSFPVTMVSYNDAVAYCNWLSQRDSKRYRLPTEIEWEYCCRAGNFGSYPFPSDQRDQYNWWLESVGDQLSPRPVGTLRPNDWGLYDMTGNVREWCLDWFSETAYQRDANLFPEGPNHGQLRAVRGGCYMDLESFSRSSHRGYFAPNTSVGNQGFRIIEVLP